MVLRYETEHPINIMIPSVYSLITSHERPGFQLPKHNYNLIQPNAIQITDGTPDATYQINT